MLKTQVITSEEYKEMQKKKGRGCKEKEYIQSELDHFKFFVPEYKFLTDRKFRFDWAWPEFKIAIEYEGIFADKARHTNKMGYSKDTEKYNLATINGWRVLRYTAMTYKNVYPETFALVGLVKSQMPDCEF